MKTDRWHWRRIGAGVDWRIRAAYRRLRSRRSVSSTFRSEILRRYGVESAEELSDPTVRMWLDFALSTVERGREAVRRMGGHGTFSKREVLDVGCAYGGFLVAANEAGALSVTGIDINQGLLDTARLLMSDHRVDAELAIADITEPEIEHRLGTFDVILCNDVIEHVVDPVACARNLSALLRPGGIVYLEIPNAAAVEFMVSDGHYGLPGITLLDRADAETWWRLHFGEGDAYGVEHYAPLDYYLSIFSQNDLWIRQVNPPNDEELTGVIHRLRDGFDRLEKELARLDNEDPVPRMRLRAEEARGIYQSMATRYEDSRVDAERDIVAGTLVNRYERQFWTLIGRKLA